jgi:beta-lactamase regulating signal transducer with metallopeptidase domain
MELTALSLTFNSMAYRAAELAVASLWQGALVACVLAFGLRFTPRISAGYRFAAWAAAFVALVGLPVSSILVEFFTGAAHQGISQTAGTAARPWLYVDPRWSVAIAALWLVASFYRAGDLTIHSLRLRKLWKDAQPVKLEERVQALLADAAADCGRGRVEVCTTATLQRPSVIGFFKPRILIPDWLYGRLTQGEMEQIVLHEVEHLRRRDDWTNLVQKLCLVVFPLNPALAWIERRLCREREMACDEGVVRVTHAPRAYAACLASLAERGLERHIEALSLGAWQRRPELVHRVHSILRGKAGLSPVGARVLMGTVGCGLLAGSVMLARVPQLVAFAPAPGASQADRDGNSTSVASVNVSPKQAIASSKAASSYKIHAASPYTRGSGAPVALDVTLRQPEITDSATLVQTRSTMNREEQTNVIAKSEPRVAQDVPVHEWIVLAAWEQVEPIAGNAQVKADYDTQAQAASQSETSPQMNEWPSNRITVTQLIFKIMPVNAGASSTNKPAADPSTSHPGIAALHDGWLVLQL